MNPLLPRLRLTQVAMEILCGSSADQRSGRLRLRVEPNGLDTSMRKWRRGKCVAASNQVHRLIHADVASRSSKQCDVTSVTARVLQDSLFLNLVCDDPSCNSTLRRRFQPGTHKEGRWLCQGTAHTRSALYHSCCL